MLSLRHAELLEVCLVRKSGRDRQSLSVAALSGLVIGTGVILAATVMSTLAAVMARKVVTPSTRYDEDVRILAVDDHAHTVTLSSTGDTTLPGRYGLWFSKDTGHARIGDIVASTPSTVTRTLIDVDFGDIHSATRGRTGAWFYLGPWDLELPFENVVVQTPLGNAPAWLVPSAHAEPSGRWVIQVHGRGVRRQEALRALPVFHEAGFTSLLVSYRNDGDAPQSSDKRYGLGDVEWRDVDAALEYAAAHGATSVVLMGWSMGGAIVLQAATRSTRRELIAGIVLDSPVVNWNDVLAYQGKLLRLPSPVAVGAVHVLSQPWGGVFTGQEAPIDFRRLDFVARAGELDLPMLVMHSDDDGYVPSTASRQLAELRPDIVTFVPFTVATHTRLWNYDRDKWNEAIATWLAVVTREVPKRG